ncbi:hypothetical protein QL285_092611 [Trifolium repens]|jgi:hypothetical protein|nr:hypothetical protein QL285_092611 [Trifolium repens]
MIRTQPHQAPKVARNLGGESNPMEKVPIDDSAKQRPPVMTDSITEMTASHIPVMEKVTADAEAVHNNERVIIEDCSTDSVGDILEVPETQPRVQPVSPLQPASKQPIL